MARILGVGFGLLLGGMIVLGQDLPVRLTWSQLPPLPDPLGVAGPFAGVHGDALIVAGGANFAKPVWDNEKSWHDGIHVLVRDGNDYRWIDGGVLPRAIAYGAAVSTKEGVVCIGGNNASETFRDVFLLQVDPSNQKVSFVDFPSLPEPCAYGSAVLVDDVIYLVAGQRGLTLDTATNQVWMLDLAKRPTPEFFRWERLDPMPGPSRAFHIMIAHQDGNASAIYVISGRRQQGEAIQFLRDVWQYTPSSHRWRRCADVPRCVMAGTGAVVEANKLIVLGGADGSLFHQADQLRDDHPGFPKLAWVYDSTSDRWSPTEPVPSNHVTTIAVMWNDTIVIPSGEIRPRVRSPNVWMVRADVAAPTN